MRDCQHAYWSLVARDSKVEQSVNRFLKIQGEYVCVTTYGEISAVAEFGLLFQEKLKIVNLVNHVIGNKSIWHLERSYVFYIVYMGAKG